MLISIYIPFFVFRYLMVHAVALSFMVNACTCARQTKRNPEEKIKEKRTIDIRCEWRVCVHKMPSKRFGLAL